MGQCFLISEFRQNVVMKYTQYPLVTGIATTAHATTRSGRGSESEITTTTAGREGRGGRAAESGSLRGGPDHAPPVQHPLSQGSHTSSKALGPPPIEVPALLSLPASPALLLPQPPLLPRTAPTSEVQARTRGLGELLKANT